jgi:hypothetical protein
VLKILHYSLLGLGVRIEVVVNLTSQFAAPALPQQFFHRSANDPTPGKVQFGCSFVGFAEQRERKVGDDLLGAR